MLYKIFLSRKAKEEANVTLVLSIHGKIRKLGAPFMGGKIYLKRGGYSLSTL